MHARRAERAEADSAERGQRGSGPSGPATQPADGSHAVPQGRSEHSPARSAGAIAATQGLSPTGTAELSAVPCGTRRPGTRRKPSTACWAIFRCPCGAHDSETTDAESPPQVTDHAERETAVGAWRLSGGMCRGAAALSLPVGFSRPSLATNFSWWSPVSRPSPRRQPASAGLPTVAPTYGLSTCHSAEARLCSEKLDADHKPPVETGGSDRSAEADQERFDAPHSLGATGGMPNCAVVVANCQQLPTARVALRQTGTRSARA